MNKLNDQYNNTFHHSVNKKAINADYSALTEKIETVSQAPKFKANDRIRITKHNNIFIFWICHWELVKRKNYYWFCFENQSLDL